LQTLQFSDEKLDSRDTTSNAVTHSLGGIFGGKWISEEGITLSRNFELLQRAEKEQERPGMSSQAPRPLRKVGSAWSLDSEVQDEVVKLIQRVFTLPSKAPRSVVFACVQPGDGSNAICLHAARVLASQGRGSVCLVDANVRAPSLHLGFGLENLRGLAQAVGESIPMRGFAHQIDGGNLWVLPWGSVNGNSQTLTSSDRFQQRFAELRAEFDYVLIDAPAVNLCADPIALGRLSDGLVLVVQLNTTRREAARNAKEALEAAKVRLLGVVLNNRKYPIPKVLYRML
jgi:Mrp family chromosome partitioning ATPase